MVNKRCSHTQDVAGCPECHYHYVLVPSKLRTQKACLDAHTQAVDLYNLLQSHATHLWASDSLDLDAQYTAALSRMNTLHAAAVAYGHDCTTSKSNVEEIIKNGSASSFDQHVASFMEEVDEMRRTANHGLTSYGCVEFKKEILNFIAEDATLDRTSIPATMDYILDDPIGFQLGLAYGRHNDRNPSKVSGPSGKPAVMSFGATWMFGTPSVNAFREDAKPAGEIEEVSKITRNLLSANITPVTVTSAHATASDDNEPLVKRSEYEHRKQENEKYDKVAKYSEPEQWGMFTASRFLGQASLLVSWYAKNSTPIDVPVLTITVDDPYDESATAEPVHVLDRTWVGFMNWLYDSIAANRAKGLSFKKEVVRQEQTRRHERRDRIIAAIKNSKVPEQPTGFRDDGLDF